MSPEQTEKVLAIAKGIYAVYGSDTVKLIAIQDGVAVHVAPGSVISYSSQEGDTRALKFLAFLKDSLGLDRSFGMRLEVLNPDREWCVLAGIAMYATASDIAGDLIPQIALKNITNITQESSLC